jgi:hypothetical protein
MIADTLPTLPCALPSGVAADLIKRPLAEVIRNHLLFWSPAQIVQQDTKIIDDILDSLAHPGTMHGQVDEGAMEHLKNPAAHAKDLCFDAFYLQQLRAEIATLSTANPQ